MGMAIRIAKREFDSAYSAISEAGRQKFEGVRPLSLSNYLQYPYVPKPHGSTITMLVHQKPVLPSKKKDAQISGGSETIRIPSGKTVFCFDIPSDISSQQNKAFALDFFDQNGAPLVDFIVEREARSQIKGADALKGPDAGIESRTVKVAYDKSRITVCDIAFDLPRQSYFVMAGTGKVPESLANEIAEKAYWMQGTKRDLWFSGETLEKLVADASKKKGITIPDGIKSMLAREVEDERTYYYPAEVSTGGKVTFSKEKKVLFRDTRGDRWVSAIIEGKEYVIRSENHDIKAYLLHGPEKAKEIEGLIRRIMPALEKLGADQGATSTFTIGESETGKDFVLTREKGGIVVAEAFGQPGIFRSGAFALVQAGKYTAKVNIDAQSSGGGLISYVEPATPFSVQQGEFHAIMPSGSFDLLMDRG